MATKGGSILREFVVALGWQVDEQQFKGIEAKLAQVVDSITEIGGAVAVASALVDKYVTVMADRFEKLHYAAQRSGSSVKSLSNLEFGAQQIGLAAGQATSMIEGMAAAMNSSPGLKAFFGVDGKDPTKDWIHVLKQLKTMYDAGGGARAIAIQKGGMLGIGAGDLEMLTHGVDKMQEAVDLHDKMFKDAGLNPDAFGDKSVEFMNQMRTLTSAMEILFVLVADRFMPAIELLVTIFSKAVTFAEWLDKATGGVATWLAAAAIFMKRILPVITKLFRFLGITGGEAAAAGGAEAAVGEAGLAAGGEVAAGGLAGLVAMVGGWPVIIAAALAAFAVYGWNSDAGKNLRTKLGNGATTASDWISSKVNGISGNNPGNIMDPKTGRLAHFASMEDGLAAMAGQLNRDINRGQDTLSTLYGGLPDGKGGFTGGYTPNDKNNPNYNAMLARMAKDMHMGINDHFAGQDRGSLLMSLMHGTMINEHSSDMFTNAAKADALRANGISIATSTVVHVNGATDPHATGRAVADAQNDVHSRLIRNFAPKVN